MISHYAVFRIMFILLSEQKCRQNQTNTEKFLKLRSEMDSFPICIKFGISLIARIIKPRSQSICIKIKNLWW